MVDNFFVTAQQSASRLSAPSGLDNESNSGFLIVLPKIEAKVSGIETAILSHSRHEHAFVGDIITI